MLYMFNSRNLYVACKQTMSDSRESSPDTIDIEVDPASRNVRQRRSPTPDNFHIGEPSHMADHTDSEEEPSEDEDTIPPIHSRTPSPLLSASPPSSLPPASPLSPLPPVSPPTPVAPPSPLPSTVPHAPIAPSPPVLPSLSFSTRNQGVTLRYDWMPIILGAWRDAEQLPVIPMPYELHTPTLPLTGEAIHHSIPVMVARLRTHDEQLEELDTVLETLPTRVGALEQQADRGESDLQELRDGLVETHDRGVQTHDEVAMLRQELSEWRDIVVDTHARGVEAQQEIAALRQEVAALRQELAQRDQSRADAPSS